VQFHRQRRNRSVTREGTDQYLAVRAHRSDSRFEICGDGGKKQSALVGLRSTLSSVLSIRLETSRSFEKYHRITAAASKRSRRITEDPYCEYLTICHRRANLHGTAPRPSKTTVSRVGVVWCESFCEPNLLDKVRIASRAALLQSEALTDWQPPATTRSPHIQALAAAASRGSRPCAG
jgi:hypothetical protein